MSSNLKNEPKSETKQNHPKLTERQQRIFDFIKLFIANNNFGPTLREIGAVMKINSNTGVRQHLKTLEKKGLIELLPNKSRGIRLVDSQFEANFVVEEKVKFGPVEIELVSAGPHGCSLNVKSPFPPEPIP